MNNSSNHSQHPSHASGFSLVEVLVALVILSVGMLGVLTLQVKGLQFSQSARINTNAVVIAADMADRIRANPMGGAAYDDEMNFSAAAASPPEPACADLQGAPLAVDATCTPAQLAAFDVWQWKTALLNDTGMPRGKGGIDVVVPAAGLGAATTEYTITVQYSERGEQLSYSIVINN